MKKGTNKCKLVGKCSNVRTKKKCEKGCEKDYCKKLNKKLRAGAGNSEKVDELEKALFKLLPEKQVTLEQDADINRRSGR